MESQIQRLIERRTQTENPALFTVCTKLFSVFMNVANRERASEIQIDLAWSVSISLSVLTVL